MDTNKKIVVGEWLCALEGIAIAERIHDLYYEEYYHIPKGKKVGDYLHSLVEYKVFCDYEGNPRKSHRFRDCNTIYCDPLDEKWKVVLENSIKDHPKEYKSFVKFLKEPKHAVGYRTLSYEIPVGNRLQVINAIENLKESLPERFTFEDLLKKAEEHHFPINLKDVLKDTYLIPECITLILFFTYGEFRGKRILFKGLEYIKASDDSR